MELISHPVLGRISIVIGAGVLVAAFVTGCTEGDQEETTVQEGKIKGAVGTSVDRDVPIEEANREIRTTTESTTKGTRRKATNPQGEGDQPDTRKRFEQ